MCNVQTQCVYIVLCSCEQLDGLLLIVPSLFSQLSRSGGSMFGDPPSAGRWEGSGAAQREASGTTTHLSFDSSEGGELDPCSSEELQLRRPV